MTDIYHESDSMCNLLVYTQSIRIPDRKSHGAIAGSKLRIASQAEYPLSSLVKRGEKMYFTIDEMQEK